MKGWGSIAIAVRMAKYTNSQFVQFYAPWLIHEMRRGDQVLQPAVGYPAHYAANAIVHSFLEQSSCDTLLFIDDDQLLFNGMLSTMRDNEATFPFDAVMGLIVMRGYKNGRYDSEPAPTDNAPLVMELVEPAHPDPKALNRYRYKFGWKPGDVVKVDALGLGFTLMRREMLGVMATEFPMPFEYPDFPGGSEDVVFCRRAAPLGYTFAIDTNVRPPHGRMEWLQWTEPKEPGLTENE